MNVPPGFAERVRAAYERARDDLLAERVGGHWVGELSTSALSTATALSALALYVRHAPANDPRRDACTARIAPAIDWLAAHPNADGGFGDTDKSLSNIATTMLVRAALHLAGVADHHAELLRRAEGFIEAQGDLAGLRRRYGRDKTFAVPILTNCALAGLADWRQIAPLPFEMACLPYPLLRFLRLPVVSYAVPALVAIGQARFVHARPRNPLTAWIRSRAVEPSLRVLQQMQPESGGFLEAAPLTSFVCMSLIGVGRCRHPVVARGIDFLLGSARPDGSWPIDTNLATWVTTLAVNALESGGDTSRLGLRPDLSSARSGLRPDPSSSRNDCTDWLLGCQHRRLHPFTHAEPGGWAWTDLSGGVPDADDTPGALLALAALRKEGESSTVDAAVRQGVKWLLDLQNHDGGWPTFCRGWGALPFDRSGVDLTAHAIRALYAWRVVWDNRMVDCPRARLERAIARGFRFLARRQRADGAWVPLWFGNQWDPQEENPVYGTARVLLAYRDLGRSNELAARRGSEFLVKSQLPDGGWGPADVPPQRSRASVEETAVAVEALLEDVRAQDCVLRGVQWLTDAVESQRHREASPIGFYFARLWYYEKLYPMIFTVSALGRASRGLGWKPSPTTTADLSTHTP